MKYQFLLVAVMLVVGVSDTKAKSKESDESYMSFGYSYLTEVKFYGLDNEAHGWQFAAGDPKGMLSVGGHYNPSDDFSVYTFLVGFGIDDPHTYHKVRPIFYAPTVGLIRVNEDSEIDTAFLWGIMVGGDISVSKRVAIRFWFEPLLAPNLRGEWESHMRLTVGIAGVQR
jgi:hypothetical protein